jgi:hypothetical protein
MLLATFWQQSEQLCHDNKNHNDGDCVEHADPQRAVVASALHHIGYDRPVRAALAFPDLNCSVHRKDSYFDFECAAAFTRRTSFIAATATAVKAMRSTTPYIMKTIQGLPDSRLPGVPALSPKQTRVAAIAADVNR